MNKLDRRDVIRIGLVAGGSALLPGLATRAFAAGAPEFLTINGGGQGGAWYLGAAAIGELCKKDVWPGVSVTVQAGGGKINIRQLHQKKIDFGFMFALDATHAYKGKLDYKGNAMTNLRAVMSTNLAYVETVVKPGIKSYAELDGKAVDPGRAGMTGLVTFKYIVDALGLKVKLVNSGYPEMASLFKDGVVQGVSVIGSNPHTAVSEIMSTSKGALLPVDDKLAKIMIDKYDYEPVTIPANTYPSQTKDVPSFGSVTQFVTHADVPEEWVYKVTKVTWEHRQRLVQAHKAYKELDKKMVLKGVRIPLHPGAARYWKEVGIKS